MRMMKKSWHPRPRRGLVCLLVFTLLLGILPVQAAVNHGVVTHDKVIFRTTAGGDINWGYLNKGWVAKVLSETKAGGHNWFRVETSIPAHPTRTYFGYIRADFFRLLTEEEEANWLVNKPQPDPTLGGAAPAVSAQPTATTTATATASTAPTVTEAPKPAPTLVGDYGLVTEGGANLRETPDGASVTALIKDQFVKVLEYPSSGKPWYKVQLNGTVGYLQTHQLRVLSPAELAAYQATPAPTVSGDPIKEEQPTSGTLRITKNSTNLRKDPGGTSLFQYLIGTELAFTGAPVFSGGFDWLRVVDTRRNLEGYVRSDCYQILTGNLASAAPTASPSPPPASDVDSASVRITLGGTNLRMSPGGTIIGSLDRNRILPFYGRPTTQGSYNWVYVYDEKSQQYGYVRSDCYEFVKGAPAPIITASPAPVITAQPTAGVPEAGTLTLTKGGVNLRNAPGGQSFAQLDRGLVMPYFSYILYGGYTWYNVESPRGSGWVRNDVVQLHAGVPGQTPPPTAAPPVSALGYVLTTKSEINLRQAASSTGSVLGKVDRGLVLALAGPIRQANGYNWFQVNVGGITGFLRGDCVRQLSNQEVADWINHGLQPQINPPGGGTAPIATGFVVTTADSVNVRASASTDGRALGNVATAGSAFPLLATLTSGGRLWYKISFEGQEGYLLSSFARMMSQAEYAAWLASQPTPSPTPAPTPTPAPEDMSLTAITKIESVIIRSAAASTANRLAIIYKKGAIVALRGQTEVAENYTWYAVRVNGINGWVRGDLLRVLTKVEEQLLSTVGDPDAPKPASYRTLRLGDSGEDVTRLQQELNRLGLLVVTAINGNYDSLTAQAVRAYQKQQRLTEDGIAGSETQHKLYNTVPEGSYDPGGGSTVNPSLFPVELVDWYTGDINAYWGRGEVAVLTDVATGISLRIKRWAGGYHVDGEPLTSADTQALTRIYGVKNAQEILEKNLYQRRPVWITLKNRSFAASLYGVPHNYPEGDTIPGNDFNGQLCVHFYNSRVHTSGTVDANHMRAIQRAYDAAPTKK